MAIIKEEKEKNLQQASTQQTPAQQKPSYIESDTLKQAQSMIQQQLAQKPGQYQSPWQTQLNDTISKILNREKFSYDLNGDALMKQYKNQFVNQGKMAMMDTMGQAAAMTGGYGNSYAQSVGQQAYQGYLQQLNDKVPELYSLALSKYQMDGNALKDQYSVLGTQDAQEYGRYRDTVADAQWQAEFDEAMRRYNYEHGLGEFAPKSIGGGGGDPMPRTNAYELIYAAEQADRAKREAAKAQAVKEGLPKAKRDYLQK